MTSRALRNPRPRRVGAGALTTLLVVAGSAAVGLGIAVHWRVAAAAVVLALAAVVLLLRPSISVPLTVVLALGAFPSAVLPYQTSLAGFTVFLYEPVLACASAWALKEYGLPASHRRGLALLLALLALGGVMAWVQGNSGRELLGDVRGLSSMGSAFVCAGCLLRGGVVRGLLPVLRWTLWASALMTVVSSATGLVLAGRSEIAGLALVGGVQQGAGVLRVISPATTFSLAVVCVCVGLMIFAGVSLGTVWRYLAPALVIVLFSFSRNILIALAVTVGFSLLANRRFTALARLSGLVVWSALGTAVAALVAGTGVVPGGEWLMRQSSAFAERVVTGIRPDTLARDYSAQARTMENDYAARAVAEAPLLGHGFGYAYRPPVGDSGGVGSAQLPYYVHNFYYWLLVKAGLVGLVLFLAFAVPPIMRALRQASPEMASVAGASLSLLAVSIVAPLPLGPETASSVVVGALLGFLGGHRDRSGGRGRDRPPEKLANGFAGRAELREAPPGRGSAARALEPGGGLARSVGRVAARETAYG